MTTILSLDPGITTGFAVLADDGRLLDSGNIMAEDLRCHPKILQFVESTGVEVVIEPVLKPTRGKLADQLADVWGTLRMYFPNAAVVGPGQWKQNSYIFNYPFPKERFPRPTPHQRDAFRIGIYYITYLRKEA